MGRILVVDDDPHVLAAFERLLAAPGHAVRAAATGESALSAVAAEKPDLVIMDVRLPGISGLDTFRQIKKSNPRLPVIIMTGYATTDAAIEAMKLGAFDYHVKPPEPEEMLRSVEAALECVRLMGRPVALDSEAVSPASDAIVGQTRSMQQVYKAIGRVAETDATVLIRGETGTGKELVARAIYQHSLRANAPLIVVNCAAIPETLLESELFGHERGAFTGAQNRRIGKFEQADGGTVFLDEIGDVPLGVQAKLLRVLQERTFERIGGNEILHADVRVLAATNRDLEDAMARGRFREDLYHRLKVFTIDLAPLRERTEDIPRLAAYFLQKFAQELKIDKPLLTAAAMDALRQGQWPGNVRELEHCIHRAMILTKGYPIQPDDVHRALEMDSPAPARPPAAGDSDRLSEIVQNHLRSHFGENTHSDFMDLVEKALLAEALRMDNGNQTHTARRLGIARPTLKAKIDKHNLSP
ncbi:MAG: sigma-54 dependent transcriptional regulator [Candidatus Sumerlaeota bacterium]|nr:sigma-54 dependent transcriptional regulator [Candidatus Sumerlaeota bacterium]